MMASSETAVNRKIHPFFSDPKSREAVSALVTPEPSCSPNSAGASGKNAPDSDLDRDGSADQSNISVVLHPRKRQRTGSVTTAKSSAKRSRGRLSKQGPSHGKSTANTLDTVSASSAKLITPAASDDQAEKDTLTCETRDGTGDASPILSIQNSSTAPDSHSTSGDEKKSQKIPQKVLQLNPKTGTIGPPPASNKEQKPASVLVSGKRLARGKEPKSCLVRISYGTDAESRARLGDKISDILSGGSPKPPQGALLPSGLTETDLNDDNSIKADKSATNDADSTTNAAKLKPVHPFFAPKSKQMNQIVQPESAPAFGATSQPESIVKRQNIFTSTPSSPKPVHTAAGPKFNFPQFGSRPAGPKVPGAQHPLWPCQGMAHVRGDEPGSITASPPSHPHVARSATMNERKAKGRQIQPVSGDESIINSMALDLRLEDITKKLKNVNTDDFQPSQPSLRIPQRRFETGHSLQSRIAAQLRTLAQKPHPAIAHAFAVLKNSKSAFDAFTCETSTWSHKYAPTTADHVLQLGREPQLLKEWLLRLKVQSVDTGSVHNSKVGSRSKVTKKRPKRKKLDDFIVSSDDEADELSELSEPEMNWTPKESHGHLKTVVRMGGLAKRARDGRLANAVLLSGPHGCGKTATVYAVAKELDFEVFEISPGSRRNGRDVLEKIGDMTRNHLVQHKQPEETMSHEEDSEDELARDLKSGKQGTMTSFFKPNCSQIKTPEECQKPEAVRKQFKKSVATSSNSSSQKQSLILFEEVDILYEEDKQFWATVVSLMVQSKRPFVMTCNDENLVPMQSIDLYGILRLSSPPRESAIDLLLLIGANQGHALERDAVESLYDSRQQDLRASIAELSYWCQMGIGDKKGGYGWFRDHAQRGDVGALMDKGRVVSMGTYKTGMGWFGHDPYCDESARHTTRQTTEQELLHQALEVWSLDVSEFSFSSTSRAQILACGPNSSRAKRITVLSKLDEFADTMSAMDICSGGVYSTWKSVQLDPEHPDIPTKTRDDFTVGRCLLDVQPVARYSALDIQVATTMKSLSRALLVTSDLMTECGGTPLNEDKVIDKVRQSFHDPPYTTPTISREDYSAAFDDLAVSDKVTTSSGGFLDPSIFDRTMELITLDVAPYVRTIVAYDQRLQAERLLRSKLLSQGGQQSKKRLRTTRSSYSALEGGSRASTRRECYFTADINPTLIMRTGGEGWEKLGRAEMEAEDGQGENGQRTARNSRLASNSQGASFTSSSGDEMDVATG